MRCTGGTTRLRTGLETRTAPVVLGLRRVVLQGYELYAAAAGDPRMLSNYGRGTPDDWLAQSPRVSVQPWELDVGWLFICLFRALGLARVSNIRRQRAEVGG